MHPHPHQITVKRARAASACWTGERLEAFCGPAGLTPRELIDRMYAGAISPADCLWALCCATDAHRLHLECALEYAAGLQEARGVPPTLGRDGLDHLHRGDRYACSATYAWLTRRLGAADRIDVCEYLASVLM